MPVNVKSKDFPLREVQNLRPDEERNWLRDATNDILFQIGINYQCVLLPGGHEINFEMIAGMIALHYHEPRKERTER
jgi:hypothetical protein